MKKFISAVIVCAFICTMAVSALAAVSPSAPTIPDETSTKEPTTVDSDQETTTVVSDESTTKKADDETTTKKTDVDESTTKKPDVDETTTDVDDVTSTTKNEVTSDKKPVSPDTGSYLGKSASAAALVALTLGGAAVYTSKKKVTE